MIAEHAKSGVRHSYTSGGVICNGRQEKGRRRGGRQKEKGGDGRGGKGEGGNRGQEGVGKEYIVSVGCSPRYSV
jgi:hypothetical protein